MNGKQDRFATAARSIAALLISTASIVLYCVLAGDGLVRRGVSFRYDVKEAKLAPLLKKSLVYYKTESDPVLSERQKVAVDVQTREVSLPRTATAFRLDLQFDGTKADFTGVLSVPLEIDAKGGKREVEVHFRREKPYYAWGNFDAEEFSSTEIDAFACASVFALLFVLSFGAASAFAKRDRKFVGDKLLIAGFAACLLIPSLKIDFSDASATENRNLAEFPALEVVADKGFSAWCKQFENAYGDRFFLRDDLISANSSVLSLFDNRGNAKVLIGRDDWLFFKQTLDDFSNAEDGFPDYTVREIASFLGAIDSYAKRNGKKFVLFIAPDKCRVYPGAVPFYKKLRPDSESRTEKLVAFLRDEFDFPVIYPREEMLGMKNGAKLPLYYKGDTHWTYYGAYNAGYLPIMAAIGDAQIPLLEIEDWVDCIHWGDLRTMLGQQPTDEFKKEVSRLAPQDAFVLSRPGFHRCDGVRFWSDKKEKGDIQATVITENAENGRKKLYMLRDSFCTDMIPFFARSFEKCVARHVLRGIKQEDMPDIEKSDVILLEIVERDLGNFASRSLPAQFRKEAK